MGLMELGCKLEDFGRPAQPAAPNRLRCRVGGVWAIFGEPFRCVVVFSCVWLMSCLFSFFCLVVVVCGCLALLLLAGLFGAVVFAVLRWELEKTNWWFSVIFCAFLLDWRVIFFYSPLIYTKLHRILTSGVFNVFLGVFCANTGRPPL